jgi:hypothetical protein
MEFGVLIEIPRVEGALWGNRAAAEAEVGASRRRVRETPEPGPG